ncbi:MAG: C10 family peptidase [Prevotellaceae bacterium]|jgi:hypothetical protein|nr:C10 family peptidase [Prevotellaceae bacterium]
MKALHVLVIASAFIAVACTGDYSPEDRSGQGEIQFTDAELAMLFQMRGDGNQVTMSEAMSFADDVIGFLDGSATTRTTVARSVSAVTAMTVSKAKRATTRTSTADGKSVEIPDTLAYVFSFGEDDGFALVAADKRIGTTILAYGPSGDLNEAGENPGLMQILDETEDYAIQSIYKYESEIDSMKNEILEKILGGEGGETRSPNSDTQHRYNILVYDCPGCGGSPPTPPTTQTTTQTMNGDWTIISQVTPLLPVEWRQWYPFNEYVKTKDGATDAPAGCVAVALGQIMAYWSHPNNIDGYTFDWTLLRKFTARPNAYPVVTGKKSYPSYSGSFILQTDDEAVEFVDQAARLMERIGAYVDMTYSDDGSGSTPSDALDCLESFGYTCGDLMDYNYNTTINSLNLHRPVYIRGKTTEDKGHSWVTDGYLNQQKITTTIVTVTLIATGEIISCDTFTTPTNANYLHYNWGHGDSSNGYFVAGDFSINSDHLSSTRTSGNYERSKKIIPNIHL